MNKFTTALLFLLLSLCFYSCDTKVEDHDLIIDYVPITLHIQVVDKEGKTRLDTLAPNYLQEFPTLTYQNETHLCTPPQKDRRFHRYNETNLPKLRAILAIFSGFHNIYCEDTQSRYLYFGELDGGSNYNDDFILTWPDGTKDVIHYDRKVKGLDVKQSWSLNGKKMEGDIVIVR